MPLSTINLPIYASDSTHSSKISDILSQKLNSTVADEKVDVFLWLEDIDLERLENQIKESVGIGQKDMQLLSDRIYKTYCKEKGISFNSTAYKNSNVNTTEWVRATEDIRRTVNDQVEAYTSAKRNLLSREHFEKNSEILNELGINEMDRLFVSKFSPMCIISIQACFIPEIASNRKVLQIDYFDNSEVAEIASNVEVSANRTTIYTDSQLMNFHKLAAGAYGLSDSYSGTGMKLGTLDLDTPDTECTVLKNSNINILSNPNYHPLGWEIDDKYHATTVAAIMVGENGLIPDAELYAVKVGRYDFFKSNYYKALELLAEKNVSIINISCGVKTSANSYGIPERWIDYFSRTNNILMIFAAGNSSTDSDYSTVVWQPNASYNSISVGNFDDLTNSSFADDRMNPQSSYVSGNFTKPDLIAPGTAFPSYYAQYEIASGTSFSAPMVSSIASYVLQVNPTLKENPVLIKAILLASCNRKVLDSDGTQSEFLGGLTEKQGAGAINASLATSITMNSKFYVGTLSNKLNGDYIEIPAVEMSNTTRKSFALAWECTVKNESNDIINSPAFSYFHCNLDLHIRTTTSQTILGISAKPNSSAEVVNIPCNANTFYMKMLVNSTFPTDFSTRYALAWCGQ